MKLFWRNNDNRWFAYHPKMGWMTFPAEIDGWRRRAPVIGVEPSDLRRVPLRLGFNTGLPGAPTPTGLFLVPNRNSRLHLVATSGSQFEAGTE